jgi:pimeloyl-ACP methyl ester carboxylesterase
MFVEVNGARLFFDVEGAGVVPDGPTMRAKPTLLLLHGGPGFDHTSYNLASLHLPISPRSSTSITPAMAVAAVMIRRTWNLAQWGDDVKAFCDVLGIENPIVYGASFGGMVALAYATRHPEHPGKLIPVSTEAAGHSHLERRVELFERLGGPEVGALARRRFLEGKLGVEDMEAWVRLAFPVYRRTRRGPEAAQRVIRRPDVNHWFARPGGEGRTFDFFPALSKIRCPTLVLGGEEDPMIPIGCQEDIVAALPPHLVRFEDSRTPATA